MCEEDELFEVLGGFLLAQMILLGTKYTKISQISVVVAGGQGFPNLEFPIWTCSSCFLRRKSKGGHSLSCTV